MRDKAFRQSLSRDYYSTLKQYYPKYTPSKEDEDILLDLAANEQSRWCLPSSFKEICTAALVRYAKENMIL